VVAPVGFIGAWASLREAARGEPRTLLCRGTRPDRCARLSLLRRAYELDCRSRGGRGELPFAALGLAAALGFLLRVGVLCCSVAGEGPRTPVPAALGLAAELGSAFFGLHARWIAVVGGDPRTPIFRCAWPGRCAWFGLLSYWGEAPEPPFSAALGLAAALSSALFGARAKCIAAVGRDFRTPLLHCARPGHCAWLSSARDCAVLCRSQGRPPNPTFPLRSTWPLRSAWPFSARVRVKLP
jgi:hypothetical protein